MNITRIATICTGGGVLEQGAIASGLTPIWGVEINPSVAELYRLNYPESNILIENACAVNWYRLPVPDILHASPSCRSFSRANSKSEHFGDINLARAIALSIDQLEPQIFTLENVAAYLKSESWQCSKYGVVGCATAEETIYCDRI